MIGFSISENYNRVMATLNVHNRSGEVLHEKDLADAFTNAEVNNAVIHQCVVAYLANQRRGTASTKTRSEVKGSGRKLYRQKGTGRARVGDARSPIRVHGGVAFGPKPRSYRQNTPKQIRYLGLKSAISDSFQNEQCVLMEDFNLESPRTKDIVSILNSLNLEGKVLFVLGEHSPNILLSLRNLQKVNCCTWDMLNIYEVLWHDHLVLTESAVEKLQEKFTEPEGE